MRSYEAARGLFSFLGFCSWAVIVIGAIAAFAGASAGSGFGRNPNALQALLAALPGAGIALMGFYGLALVQMGRAGVDSAEYGQQSLDVSRKQLEVSQQILSQSKQTAATYAAFMPKKLSSPEQAADDVDRSISYASQSTGSSAAAIEGIEPETEPLVADRKAPTALPEPGIETPMADLLEGNASVKTSS